jgi:hypothetical protein
MEAGRDGVWLNVLGGGGGLDIEADPQGGTARRSAGAENGARVAVVGWPTVFSWFQFLFLDEFRTGGWTLAVHVNNFFYFPSAGFFEMERRAD